MTSFGNDEEEDDSPSAAGGADENEHDSSASAETLQERLKPCRRCGKETRHRLKCGNVFMEGTSSAGRRRKTAGRRAKGTAKETQEIAHVHVLAVFQKHVVASW